MFMDSYTEQKLILENPPAECFFVGIFSYFCQDLENLLIFEELCNADHQQQVAFHANFDRNCPPRPPLPLPTDGFSSGPAGSFSRREWSIRWCWCVFVIVLDHPNGYEWSSGEAENSVRITLEKPNEKKRHFPEDDDSRWCEGTVIPSGKYGINTMCPMVHSGYSIPPLGRYPEGTAVGIGGFNTFFFRPRRIRFWRRFATDRSPLISLSISDDWLGHFWPFFWVIILRPPTNEKWLKWKKIQNSGI